MWTSTENDRVEIAIYDAEGRTAVSASVGASVTLTIAFRPLHDVITQWSDGTITRYSESLPVDAVSEMRYCTGPGRDCSLPGRWTPFTSRQQFEVPVDWIGVRDYGVTAQFRDAKGNIIPAGTNGAPSASNWVPVSGILDERTPVALQPSRIQTIIAQARATFPVSGSIHVGQGSITGGKVGSVVDIPVRFDASSPAASVAEMRTRRDSRGRCLTPEEMNDAPWEPFRASRVYRETVALNFITFKLHVQYRDANGNLSPVYCGEIAIEGHP
jgi:hypothetical protein